MSKGIKKFLKVAGVLACIDIVDIFGKGQMLNWMDLEYPDAANDFRDNSDIPKIFATRGKMINKIADLFN